MFETLDLFWYMFWHTDYLVWCVAAVMATIVGFMLHSYSDNTLMSCVGAGTMLFSILVAQTAFQLLGIIFLGNQSANAVVAAGIAVCAVAVIWAIIFRVLTAFGDMTNPLKDDKRTYR